MSLHIVCAECKKEVGYFAGVYGQLQKDHGVDLDEKDNVLVLGPIVGTRGVSFDESKIDPQVYVCRDCVKAKMPALYATLEEANA